MTNPEPTDRQLAALRAYLAAGSVKDAARNLGIAPQTMKNHLASVYADLGVGSALEAALTLGWLRLPNSYAGCGWTGVCTRPAGHRGHHGGWRGVAQGGS